MMLSLFDFFDSLIGINKRLKSSNDETMQDELNAFYHKDQPYIALLNDVRSIKSYAPVSPQHTLMLQLFTAIYCQQNIQTITDYFKKLYPLDNDFSLPNRQPRSVNIYCMNLLLRKMPGLFSEYQEKPEKRYDWSQSPPVYDYDKMPYTNLSDLTLCLPATAQLGDPDFFLWMLNRLKDLGYPTRNLYLIALSTVMTTLTNPHKIHHFINGILDQVEDGSLTSILSKHSQSADWASLLKSQKVEQDQASLIMNVFYGVLATKAKINQNNVLRLVENLLRTGKDSLLGVEKDHAIYQELCNKMLWLAMSSAKPYLIAPLINTYGAKFNVNDNKTFGVWLEYPAQYSYKFADVSDNENLKQYEVYIESLISGADLNNREDSLTVQKMKLLRTFDFLFTTFYAMTQKNPINRNTSQAILKCIAKHAMLEYEKFRNKEPERTTKIAGFTLGYSKETKLGAIKLWASQSGIELGFNEFSNGLQIQAPPQNNPSGFFVRRSLSNGLLGELYTMHEKTDKAIHPNDDKNRPSLHVPSYRKSS